MKKRPADVIVCDECGATGDDSLFIWEPMHRWGMEPRPGQEFFTCRCLECDNEWDEWQSDVQQLIDQQQSEGGE
jgi:hypothetical protein